MLVDNFSLGFIGVALCILGYAVAAPAMTAIQSVLAAGVTFMTDHNMLVADFMVRIPVRTKQYLPDEIDSCQPMTSLFEQSVLLIGDILAKLIIEQKQLDMRSLWQYHANLE